MGIKAAKQVSLAVDLSGHLPQPLSHRVGLEPFGH